MYDQDAFVCKFSMHDLFCGVGLSFIETLSNYCSVEVCAVVTHMLGSFIGTSLVVCFYHNLRITC